MGKNILRLFAIARPVHSSFLLTSCEMYLSVTKFHVECFAYIYITEFFIFLKSLSREINCKDSVKYNKTITTIGQTIYCYCFILTFVN